MKNPFRHFRNWFKQKLVRTVLGEVDAKDVENMRVELAEIQRFIADDGWKRYVETFLDDVSRHLNQVDQTSQAARAHLDEVAGTLRHLNAEAAVLSNQMAIHASRIRAKPFQSRSLYMRSKFNDLETMGFSKSDNAGYVDFVEVFRPSFDDLVSQLRYVRQFIPQSGLAVDLGAGRGEMVSVLAAHGLNAFGIDADASMVRDAQRRGLDVRLMDISEFLDACDERSLTVVTSIQVFEHVEVEVLREWLQKISNCLVEGGLLIIETPNPHAIDAFKAFWLDVTHVRPYYPEALLHLVQEAGFESAEVWVEGSQTAVDDRLEFAGSYTLIAQA